MREFLEGLETRTPGHRARWSYEVREFLEGLETVIRKSGVSEPSEVREFLEGLETRVEVYLFDELRSGARVPRRA